MRRTFHPTFPKWNAFFLVETDLGAALHVSIKQPIDDEKRALNATDFTQGIRLDKRTLSSMAVFTNLFRHRFTFPPAMKPKEARDSINDL